MKATKRTLAVFAIACLLVTALVACKRNPAQVDDNTNRRSANSEKREGNRESTEYVYLFIPTESGEYFCRSDLAGEHVHVMQYPIAFWPMRNDDGTCFVDGNGWMFGSALGADGEMDIAKRKAEGSDDIVRLKANAHIAKMIDDTIYYFGSQSKIGRMNIDGSNDVILTSLANTSGGLLVDNGWIYYGEEDSMAVHSVPVVHNGIWRIRTDGTEKSKLIDNWLFDEGYRMSPLKIADGLIYFAMIANGGYGGFTLYTATLDGVIQSSKEILNADSLLSVREDWLYYSEGNNNFRIRLDGTNRERNPFNDDGYSSIKRIGNWYYIESRRIRTDFSRFQILQNTDPLVPGQELVYIDATPADS